MEESRGWRAGERRFLSGYILQRKKPACPDVRTTEVAMVTSRFQLEQSKDVVAFAWAERTVEEEQDGVGWGLSWGMLF